MRRPSTIRSCASAIAAPSREILLRIVTRANEIGPGEQMDPAAVRQGLGDVLDLVDESPRVYEILADRCGLRPGSRGEVVVVDIRRSRTSVQPRPTRVHRTSRIDLT